MTNPSEASLWQQVDAVLKRASARAVCPSSSEGLTRLVDSFGITSDAKQSVAPEPRLTRAQRVVYLTAYTLCWIVLTFGVMVAAVVYSAWTVLREAWRLLCETWRSL